MQSNDKDESVLLEKSLGLAAAKPLAEKLLGNRENDISLDASEVEHLGGACLQVILSAQKTWRENQKKFCVVNGSPAFDEALIRFGFSEKTFWEQEA